MILTCTWLSETKTGAEIQIESETKIDRVVDIEHSDTKVIVG